MKTIMEEAGAAAAVSTVPIECNDRLLQAQASGPNPSQLPHMEPGDSSKPPKLKKKTGVSSKRSQRSYLNNHVSVYAQLNSMVK